MHIYLIFHTHTSTVGHLGWLHNLSWIALQQAWSANISVICRPRVLQVNTQEWHTWVTGWIYLCVCMYMCVSCVMWYVYVANAYKHVCIEARKGYWVPSSIASAILPGSLSLNYKLMILVRLVGQWVLGIHLPPSFNTEFPGRCNCARIFIRSWGSKLISSFLHSQCTGPLSHLSSPHVCIF